MSTSLNILNIFFINIKNTYINKYVFKYILNI